MKKIISISLLFILLVNICSYSVFASEDYLPSGQYFSVKGYGVTILPEPLTLDDESKYVIKSDFTAYLEESSGYRTNPENIYVAYYGTLSDGSMLVLPIDTESNYFDVLIYYVIGNYVYVLPNSGAEIYIYNDHKFSSILDAYTSGEISVALLDEIAATLNFDVYYQPDVPCVPGDVDGDGEVDISDVTLVQKYIAGMSEFDIPQIKASLLTENNEITVDNATKIQKYVADIITTFD